MTVYRFLCFIFCLLSLVCSFSSSVSPVYAEPSQVNECTDSLDSLTSLGTQTLSLGNDWVLVADHLGTCRKTSDSDVDNIVVARGTISIKKSNREAILSADFSEMNLSALNDVTVTVERNSDNTVRVVAPSYSGLGMTLKASNIITHQGSSQKTNVTLINDFPWRFYPTETASNLVLYPGFFRPVFTGISDGTFGWTGSIAGALEHEFTEGSLNQPIPLTVTGQSVETVSGQEPDLVLNIGSWFGKVFGLPVESVPVVLSQVAGESEAKVRFDVNDVFGSIADTVMGVFSHSATISKIFLKLNSTDKLKLATKEAIVWGDSKIVKYSSPKLSPLLDDQRTQFLSDIEESKSSTPQDKLKFFKVLGDFFAMADNSEIDYDFISQDVALNPLFIQLGLFEAVGAFQGSIYASFNKLGDPAYYFIDTLGLDITMPPEVTQASALPFFGLEKIPLPENPFQVGLGIVELGGTISGLSDPIYDVFQLAGKGGTPVDYSKWNVDAETEGTVALVDSLELLMSVNTAGLPWPLSLKTTCDFKLGNQNGISGTGKVSLMELITGNGSFHFFIGNNAKPVDFQVGCGFDILGISSDGTFNGYFDRDGIFWLKLKDDVSYKIAGHKLAGVPFEVDFSMDETRATVTASMSWGSHICAFGGCLIHSGSKSTSKTLFFDSLTQELGDVETSYGQWLYTASNSAAHVFAVDEGNDRLTISAVGTAGTAPVFTVTAPDGTVYFMQETEGDGGLMVVDLATDDYTIGPITDEESESGFIADSDEGTTVLVLVAPHSGSYTVNPAAGTEADMEISAHTTPAEVTLSLAGTTAQDLEIPDSEGGTVTVSLNASGTRANTTVGLYARPATCRNAAYDHWHEKLFNSNAESSQNSHLTDQGDYVYRTDDLSDATIQTLGYLEATVHEVDALVTPLTDAIYLNEPATLDEAVAMQRNLGCIKLGEFDIHEDGLHSLDVTIPGNDLFQGSYQMMARQENLTKADYVKLPYTLTVTGDNLLPAPEILSVTETGEGEAQVNWTSPVTLDDDALVRVYLHDYAKGGNEDVYQTFFDQAASKGATLSGLARGNTYSVSMALLNEVATTDDSGKSRTVTLAGLTSAPVTFSPSGSDFAGSPCVKIVDNESYASFEDDGDLFIRLRVLNESGTAMDEAPVRIYLNHRDDDNLLAEFTTELSGEAYSDIHLTLPLTHLSALDVMPDDGEPSIIYDIDTDGQNEHLTYDNRGVITIENSDAFVTAEAALSGTPLILTLKKGWNLVADAIEETDIFDLLPETGVFAYDGRDMQENIRNEARGGGYFVYLDRNRNIVLRGTPHEPDFSGTGQLGRRLIGTGVDLYNSLNPPDDMPADGLTYTPGVSCGQVFALERTDNGDIQWSKNPSVIEAGNAFWCMEE